MWSHYGGGGVAGNWAVVAFFILSGFLMTAVMTGTYGYSPQGIARFAANRALRLFPSYYFLLALVIGALILRPDGASDRVHLPVTLEGWLANFSLVFPHWRPVEYFPRLITPAWALTIELFFYALIAIGLSRSLKMTLLWFAASLMLVLSMRIFGGASFGLAYGTVLDGALPFSLGALAFHVRGRLGDWLNRVPFGAVPVLAVLYFALLVLGANAKGLWGDHAWAANALGSWANLLLAVLLIVALFHWKPKQGLKVIDAAIGRLSYPLYLSHVPAKLFLTWFIPTLGGGALVLFAVGLAFALSSFCAFVIDRPIDAWRHYVRKRQAVADSQI